MRCASCDCQRWQQPSQGGLHTDPPPLLLAWMHSRVYQAAANLQFGCALVFTRQAGLTCAAVGSNFHKVGSTWTAIARMLAIQVRTLHNVLLDR